MIGKRTGRGSSRVQENGLNRHIGPFVSPSGIYVDDSNRSYFKELINVIDHVKNQFDRLPIDIIPEYICLEKSGLNGLWLSIIILLCPKGRMSSKIISNDIR